MRLRALAVTMLVVLQAAALAGTAWAQAYPNRPVRFVVPYPAGGTTDILARVIGQKLSESVGQPVIIENRAGAGGNIGGMAAAKSAADGYTLLMGAVSTIAINPTLYRNMPYDPIKELAPVTNVASVPNILVVHPSVPARSVKELIALAKAKPGTLNFASSSTGGSPHLSGELFKAMTGVNMVHVPYKGSAPALTDLIGGQVALMFDNMPSAFPHVKSGKLIALAVTSPKRSPAAPDLPTIAEAGVPGYEATAWFGVLVPAATPRDIVTKLNTEIVKSLRTSEVRERLAAQGAEAIGDTPEQFGAFIRAEVTKWAKVIRDSGARAD